MVNDPIADSLTRVRNAQMVRKDYVDILYSKVILGVVNILKENGFIKNIKVVADEKQSYIRLFLRYDSSKKPIINEIKRVSKPGLRKYSAAKNLRPYKNGVGIRILTTSKGILSDVQARKDNIGGEVICEIW